MSTEAWVVLDGISNKWHLTAKTVLEDAAEKLEITIE